MCIRCGSIIKAIDAYIAKADSDLAATLGDEGYIAPQETVDAISALEERVAEALLAETDYIIKAVDKADSLAQFQMDIWPKLKEGDTIQDDLQAIFLEEFGNIVRRFAGLYFSAIENGGSVKKASIEIVRVSKQTTAWVQGWSQELASIMKLNSHKEIETILMNGLEGGIGIPEFSRNIMESGIRDEWYKARRVAVTEVLTAHRAGQQEAYLQSPSTSDKMWRHTGIYINGPRQNHKDMDGQKVPKDQPFELLGADGHFYHPMYPGDTSLPPGERIECHCTTQGIVDEDILGLPLEERQRLQQEAIDELDDKWEKELEDRNKALAGFTDGDTILTPGKAPRYNTSTRGHRKEEYLHGKDAINAVMEDTGLSEKEAEKIATAIDDFTGSGFIEIREAQEAGETIGVNAEHGELLEQYIRAAPKWDGGKLYRRIVVPQEDLDAFLAAYIDDEIISQLGTSSWSSSKSGTLRSVWAETLMMDEDDVVVIFKTNGTKLGTSINHFSPTPNEQEVIISKEARWKITDAPYEMAETVFEDTVRVVYIECEEM